MIQRFCNVWGVQAFTTEAGADCSSCHADVTAAGTNTGYRKLENGGNSPARRRKRTATAVSGSCGEHGGEESEENEAGEGGRSLETVCFSLEC